MGHVHAALGATLGFSVTYKRSVRGDERSLHFLHAQGQCSWKKNSTASSVNENSIIKAQGKHPVCVHGIVIKLHSQKGGKLGENHFLQL